MPYSTFQSSFQVLLKGIEATKYNFSNDVKKKVILSLSADMKYLTYRKQGEKQSKLGSIFSITPSLRVSDIKNILFGGQTTAFIKHKKINMKKFMEVTKKNESIEL